MKQVILDLEKSLFGHEYISDRAYLESIIHDEFEEISKSGKLYGKEDIINHLLNIDGDRNIEITDFTVKFQSGNKVNANYVTFGKDTKIKAFRNSMWVLDGGNWKLYFHQGKIIE